MNRKVIIGALIIVLGVLVFAYYKNLHKEPVKIARSGQSAFIDYDSVDPKVMKQAIQQFKQPTLPPVTTQVAFEMDAQTLAEVQRRFHQPTLPTAHDAQYAQCAQQCGQLLAQATPQTTLIEPPKDSSTQAQPIAPTPTSATTPISTDTVPNKESQRSYIPPIDEGAAQQQKQPSAQPSNH